MNKDSHNRSHERLSEYWNAKRGDRPFPSEDEIDPDALKDIWPSCFLISIDNVTKRLGYRYSYLGDELIDAYGDDVKNPDVALKLISATNMPIVERCNEVVKEKKPVIDESEFVNLRKTKIRYRTCMLPLGHDGHVTHIIGCMRWKLY